MTIFRRQRHVPGLNFVVLKGVADSDAVHHVGQNGQPFLKFFLRVQRMYGVCSWGVYARGSKARLVEGLKKGTEIVVVGELVRVIRENRDITMIYLKDINPGEGFDPREPWLTDEERELLKSPVPLEAEDPLFDCYLYDAAAEEELGGNPGYKPRDPKRPRYHINLEKP